VSIRTVRSPQNSWTTSLLTSWKWPWSSGAAAAGAIDETRAIAVSPVVAAMA
jgi:hypothetical protein